MQVIGIFAVVASLIFVGLQMKQTQAIAIASQYQARAALTIEIHSARIQNDKVLSDIGNRAMQRLLDSDIDAELKTWLGNLSLEMVGFYRASITQTLVLMDNNHFQYQSRISSGGYLARIQGRIE